MNAFFSSKCEFHISLFLHFFNSALTDLYNLELDHSKRSKTVHRKNPLAHFYFLDIVVHDEIQHFEAQHIQINLSYWQCLFNRFHHIKILNLSLICTDRLLQLVAEHCPCVEYLNATSKATFNVYSLFSKNGFQSPVTDDGLMALKSCQRLRELVINEPREKYAEKQITYRSLRFLLRNIPTLEDLSYTDIVRVIFEDFDDVQSLNLRIIRHHNPTAISLRRAFRLCKKVDQLSLINWDVGPTHDAIDEICNTDYQLKTIDFQNICFDRQFNRFFEKFGTTLKSLSLTQDVAEIDLDHLITIATNCPNLAYLLSSVKKTYSNRICPSKSLRPFNKLKSLHLMGYNIELNKLLPFCMADAENLETISLTELTRVRPIVDEVILKYITSKKLRQLDLGGLVLTRRGIENVIDQLENMTSLATYCAEDCKDIMDRMKQSNYNFSIRLMQLDDESSSYSD